MMFEGNKLKASETHDHRLQSEGIVNSKPQCSKCVHTQTWQALTGIGCIFSHGHSLPLPCSQAHVHKQCSTVWYSTVQYKTAQYSTVQYKTVQYSTVQYSTVQYSTVQYSTVQHSTAQHSNAQYSNAQYSTTVHYGGTTVQYGNDRLTAMAISAIPFTMMTSRPKKVKPAISWPSLGLTGCTWVRRNKVAAQIPSTKIWKDLALYRTMVRLMSVNSRVISAFHRWKPAGNTVSSAQQGSADTRARISGYQ
jgi:hypothetical protein